MRIQLIEQGDKMKKISLRTIKMVLIVLGVVFLIGCNNTDTIKDPATLEDGQIDDKINQDINSVNDHVKDILEDEKATKEKMFVIEEVANRHNYQENKDLYIVKQNGEKKLISQDVLDWEVINNDNEDTIYYVTSKRDVMKYNLSSNKSKKVRVNDTPSCIVNDFATHKSYEVISETRLPQEQDTDMMQIIDLDTEEIILEDRYGDIGAGIYIYNNKVYYFRRINKYPNGNQWTYANNMKKCLNELVEYNLETQEEAVIFNAERELEAKSLCPKDEFLYSYILHGSEEQLYVDFSFVSDMSADSEGVYQINLESLEVRPMIGWITSEKAGINGWITEFFQLDNLTYVAMSDHDAGRRLDVYNKETLEKQYTIDWYLGKDDQYIYGTEENIGFIFDSDKKIANTLVNNSTLVKYKLDEINSEKAEVKDFDEYIDYIEAEFPGYTYVPYKIFNPSFNQEYVAKAYNYTYYGLYDKNELEPIYYTEQDITRFEIVYKEMETVPLIIDLTTQSIGVNETISVNYDAPEGTKIVVGYDENRVQVTQGKGKWIEIKGISEGNTHIRIKAQRQGYRDMIDTLSINVVK